ncbi:hypothetical protein EB231_35040 [Mesorhizobium sp. NZP2298]|nr:hypothetical protein EB231_35040 [Mesorhizobium sp. NZP2298]
MLTASLRGCCDAYPGAPALAAQLVGALKAAGYIIVTADAIRLAQAMSAEQAREDIREAA